MSDDYAFLALGRLKVRAKQDAPNAFASTPVFQRRRQPSGPQRFRGATRQTAPGTLVARCDRRQSPHDKDRRLVRSVRGVECHERPESRDARARQLVGYGVA